MKIIKRGKNPKQKPLKGTCNDCGTIVECLHKETKTLIDKDTEQGMATQYVKCPICGKDYLWVS